MKKQSNSFQFVWESVACVALMVIAVLCVVSCGGSDEDDISTPAVRNVPQGKRLVSILTNNINEYPSIEYDAFGRLSKVTETYYVGTRENPIYGIDTNHYYFVYDADSLHIYRNMETLKNSYPEKKLLFACSLNHNGYISSIYNESYKLEYDLEYDENGFLINSPICKASHVYSNNELIRSTCTYGDNPRTRYYTSSEYENKGNIQLNDVWYAHLYGCIHDFDIFGTYGDGLPTILLHAGLLGKVSKYLPKKSKQGNSETTFTYAFDSEGYPKYIEAITGNINPLVSEFHLEFK